jgi:DNA-binding LytR/AlgR family response regulator
VLRHPPNVILTTAYSEYAIQSYEFGVKDDLLKPISFGRFLQAINKVVSITNPELSTKKQQETIVSNTFMFFKSDKKVYKFYFQEILFFQGFGNYVKVHTSIKKPILVLDKLSNLENKLMSNGFIRVHKSYVINISLVKEISGNIIIIKNTEIPIGISSGQTHQTLTNEKMILSFDESRTYNSNDLTKSI